MDGKVATGFAATAATAASQWLEIAEPIVTITATLIVGGLTAWYTWERALKLRRERLEKDK